ncbi:MAG TPA: DUF1549 domain-containing protein [Pirellulaceae bacterium]|nr:DUF1549 domain-containing protein [Pirellulaceae bacterium]
MKLASSLFLAAIVACVAVGPARGAEQPGAEKAGAKKADAAKASDVASGPKSLSYNRDIRPILADNCFACHGPDKNSRKGDLRLDQADAALRSRAIVPGKPDESELITRILATDADELMPPPKSNKHLTEAQKQLLKRWIAEGAKYEAHWAFLPVPAEVVVPKPADSRGWIRTPVDAFVLDRLRQERLEPAAEATREKWLRRVSFDLTGLPPTLVQLDAFLADRSNDAYEKAVDRLLESRAFGERMANEWLDVARYADTFGYQADREMHVWPWRDWVIRAFNENLPYDQFILWQTAGDLLPDATPDQQLADFLAQLFGLRCQGTPLRMLFQRIEPGHQLGEPPPARVRRPLVGKPLQDRFDIRFGLVSEHHPILHVIRPKWGFRIFWPGLSGPCGPVSPVPLPHRPSLRGSRRPPLPGRLSPPGPPDADRLPRPAPRLPPCRSPSARAVPRWCAAGADSPPFDA